MQPIQGIPSTLPQTGQPISEATQSEKNFSKMLTGIISEVSAQQQNADKAVQDLHAGGARNLHEAMIAMEQADISIRFMVQVRNKAMDAYQEILRMQV